MLANPSNKYHAFKAVELPDRQWPGRTITSPPIWMSTDLRDGNQALIDPMSVETKLRMFKELVAIGFKEIEIGFPSASQTDFDFTRMLIEDGHIPDDVTIEVLVQARHELIERTVESVRGAKRVILHLYNPLAPSFRRIVYNTDKAGVKHIAVQGTRWVKESIAKAPEVEWVYQYSPEMFSSTELEFSKEVCDAVVAEWGASADNKIILNLPATVEMATPNTFADQVEWMHRHLEQRDAVIISVHPHNDRGTAVAAAELAVMAGADRVEGCLFGNGERTGNVDLVTLALNLYSQGVHPGLDFSRLDQIRQLVETCTQLPVHPRHPYAGELVFTAFSGSHQDAIKKGLALQTADQPWEVPYLPVDPADLNRSYDAVVRVNSQSGKGGVSFLLQQAIGLELPRRLQIEFSGLVQHISDESGKEIKSDAIVQLFNEAYLAISEPYSYVRSAIHEQDHLTQIELHLKHKGEALVVKGQGNGPVDAAAQGIRAYAENSIEIVDYHEHSVGAGSAAAAVCYLEVKVDDRKPVFGVGQDCNITVAALKALLNAINRSL